MKLSWRSVGPYVLVAVAFWVYGTCQYAAGGRNAQLEDSTRAADRRVALLLGEVNELRAREAIQRARADSLAARPVRIVQVRAHTDTVLVTDSTGWAALAAERAETDSVNSALVDENRIWRGLYETVAAQRDSLAQALAVQRNLAEAWRKRARPGILEQARRSVPFAAAAVLVWEVARE